MSEELINGFTGFAKKNASNAFEYTRKTDVPPTSGSASFDPDLLRRISQTDRRWAWVEVDLNDIRYNCSAVRRMLARNVKMMAVVKADAFGHGAVQVAQTALNSGADYLGVGTVQEAVQLREALVNAPILVLDQPPQTAIPLLLGYKIMPTVYDAEFAIRYAEAADELGLRAPFHLMVNTGMNHMGVRHDEVVPFMHQVSFHRALQIVGIYTQFATADFSETFELQTQARRFIEAVGSLKSAGMNPGIVHCANSAAAIRFPDMQFDMVRVGMALYGYHPCHETRMLLELRPAMSVHARVCDTRLVPMSEGVGYGLTYRSPGSIKVCTIPIGYGDGLRMGLSGNIDVIAEGHRFRQVGEICMDQCTFEVDLRSYGTKKRVDPQVGDEVLILGRDGDSVITATDLAKKLGTVEAEVTIGFAQRLPRVYK